jgi:hypothetical protein
VEDECREGDIGRDGGRQREFGRSQISSPTARGVKRYSTSGSIYYCYITTIWRWVTTPFIGQSDDQ